MPRREDETAGAAVRCRDVRVDYSRVRALSNVSLTIDRGEVVALLGASGSGKSTLLNAIAGLVQIDEGEIWLGDRLVAHARGNVPPEQRQVGMVFQNFALWPHLSVVDTVAYPLRRSGQNRREAAAEAMRLLQRLEIDHLAGRRPAQLSGGEQQRVGLARALARKSGLYLLDEPTAHLDTHLRMAFLESVRERQRVSGAAVVYATHDAGEALALADRVALLVDGRLVHLATPHRSYTEPPTEAAARLTGPCSLLGATVQRDDDGLAVDFGQGAVHVEGGGPAPVTPVRRLLLIRPDWIGEGGPFTADVTVAAFRGPGTDYRLATTAGPLGLTLPGAPRYAVGERLRWNLKRAWVLDGPAPSANQAAPSAQPNAATAPAWSRR